VRRFVVLTCALLILSACGGRKATVSVPAPSSTVPTPNVSPADSEGLASYYAEPYHGRPTASGEIFDSYKAMTAAHRTLPFNTMVRVTNKANGETVDVRINDRGPFVDGRVIDLSMAAARKIDMVRAGVVPVKLHVMKLGEGTATGNTTNTPNTSTSGTYTVQIAAFSTIESAENLKKRLSGKFSDISVQKYTAPNMTIYRVRVGNEPDLEAAEKLASQLRKHDLTPFVVRQN
jgi:rare lipoprotein A